MENKSLYQIEQSLLNIQEQIELQGGELTEEQEVFLKITEKDLQQKSGNYLIAINIMEKEIELAKDYELKAQQEIKRREKKIQYLKDRLKDAVLMFGDIKVDMSTITLRKSESLEIINADDIPNQYKTVKQNIVIDKMSIKKDIKDGKTVKGAVLNENQNLSIK